MLELVRSLVVATTHFMAHQAGVGHFEFLGLDFIADETGRVWLIEGTCLHGMFRAYRCIRQCTQVVLTVLKYFTHRTDQHPNCIVQIELRIISYEQHHP